ncbi:hypothetical protein [Caldimonas tepidiphila]|uniref:hypothetical protein n=1 Tax=Caldimonas tepidiphila TaxID=2315841 RepID=UPI000E5B8C77|nr:hypothetical protein [Caldimonas tepidiphila]
MKLAAKRKQMQMSPKQKADRSTASNSDSRRGGGGHGSQMSAHQQGKETSVSGTRGKGKDER